MRRLTKFFQLVIFGYTKRKLPKESDDPMKLLDDLLAQFPPDVQASVHQVWEALGPNEKASFLALISGFPSETGLVKMLVKLSAVQIRQAFGSKRRVAIVGPTNVGKSTLYNQLVQHKGDRAEVSPLPGTTKENQQADAALFTVVDTPGADAVGAQGELHVGTGEIAGDALFCGRL